MSTRSLRSKKKTETPPQNISQESQDSSNDNNTENNDTNEEDKEETNNNEENSQLPPTPAPEQVQQPSTPDDEASDSKSVQSEEDGNTILNYWDGETPSTPGLIAKTFTHEDHQATDQEHEDLVNFLYSNRNENKANKLQFDTTLIPFMSAVPGTTRKVRIVYGVGSSIGLTGIQSNNLENKVLALSGEYEEGISYPSVLQFPAHALTPCPLNTPTFDQFHDKFDRGHKKASWFKYCDLTSDANLPLLIPVPAICICDGFEYDLDAAIIFERVNALPADRQESLKNSIHLIRTFITAIVVKYKKADPTIFPNIDTYMTQTSSLLNKWKRDRIHTLIPSTKKGTATNATESPVIAQTPSLESAGSRDKAPTWSPEAFLTAFQAMTTAATPTTKESTKDTNSDTEKTLGLGTFAYNLLLDLCGLDNSTADEITPLWKQLSEKNLNKSDKLTFVRRAIENRVKWSDAKVLPLNSLLTMIVQRSWEGETTLSSLTSAAKGLTPFGVPCLSESEVTAQNDLADALDAASSTTVKDHSTLKLVASAPTTFDGLVKRIKRFGNLLFAVFDETSALFMQIEDMIEALDSYGEYARTTMSHQTIASILWITHLQSRHYAAGAMKGKKAIKAEFTNMMNAIITKAPVLHMDTPPTLYNTTQTNNTRKREEPSTPTQDSPTKKNKPNDNADRYKLVERNVMNIKVKTAMTPILNLPRIPNMGKLCRAARANVGDLFPSHKDICIRSQILGKCFTSCTHKHVKLSDREVETALKILEPIIANPSLVKVN